MARPICLRLLVHWARRAASRADCTAGSSSAIKTAMMAMTTKSSISVKPRALANRSMGRPSKGGMDEPNGDQRTKWGFANRCRRVSARQGPPGEVLIRPRGAGPGLSARSRFASCGGRCRRVLELHRVLDDWTLGFGTHRGGLTASHEDESSQPQASPGGQYDQ